MSSAGGEVDGGESTWVRGAENLEHLGERAAGGEIGVGGGENTRALGVEHLEHLAVSAAGGEIEVVGCECARAPGAEIPEYHGVNATTVLTGYGKEGEAVPTERSVSVVGRIRGIALRGNVRAGCNGY